MARTDGPLFSLAAHGTFKGQLVFRSKDGATHAYLKPTGNVARSAGQVAHAAAVADMAAAWSALSQATKDVWIACAATYSTTGYKLFWQEWFLQGSSPGNPPTSPC